LAHRQLKRAGRHCLSPEGRQRRPNLAAARLVHSQKNSALSASSIATIFSMEAFGRPMPTHDSHSFNSAALSQSVTNDSVSLAIIGASAIVRMANRTIATARRHPSVSGVGYPETNGTRPDVGASNALQRAIFIWSLSFPGVRKVRCTLWPLLPPVRVVFSRW